MSDAKVPMLVTYTGHDEVLVTTEANERAFIKEYFKNGFRNVENYDREVGVSAHVKQSMRCEVEER